ncbi:MAG TPA: hypothetical protein VK348_09055 [Planctomycetota bacterium]|nr:hypothetical protein [Planctomycetota bacterium]
MVVAIPLALPNCGPLTAALSVLDLGNSKVAVEVGNHGRFEVVARGYFPMRNYVGIQTASAMPFFDREVLMVFGAGRQDIFPRDVDVAECVGGVHITVRDDTPWHVDLTDADLRLARWFGPRAAYEGRLGPLWTWFDAVDSLLLLSLAAWLFVISRAKRS